MSRRYALRDDPWDRTRDRLTGRTGHLGVTAKDNRLFVEAVLYRYRACIPWRDLPERFGDFRVIHLRHSRWSRSGVWQKVFDTLSKDADNEYAMIDSTIVRAHQHSAGAKRERGAGQASDLEDTNALLPGAAVGALLADRAYDGRVRVIEPIQRMGAQIVIPCYPIPPANSSGTATGSLYRDQHLIENSHAPLKPYRAVATRYDNTARNFLSTIDWFASVISLN